MKRLRRAFGQKTRYSIWPGSRRRINSNADGNWWWNTKYTPNNCAIQHVPSMKAPGKNRLLTPALSSAEEERETDRPATLNGTTGLQYWRSLEEVAKTKEFQQSAEREFPAGASEWEDGVSRRNFLKLTGASLALAGLNACTKQPVETIVPYVRQPEEVIFGQAL